MAEEVEAFSRFEELFWHVSRNMGYIWKQIFEHRFPGSQSFLMFTLERKGPKKMSELADVLRLTPGAVTLASDKLIEQGYIDRIRDAKDRRVVYLEMTDKGKGEMEKLRNEGRNAMKQVFNNLSETELQQLIETFEHASSNITKFQGEFGG